MAAAQRFANWPLVVGPPLALVIAFLPLQPDNPDVARMAAMAFLMALWWITGALPLAATALLPVVLLPALGILSANDVPPLYVNDIIFLFMGGFLVALAMERWNLHRRIALRLLLVFGDRPAGMLFGFMAPTFFLSMWISNTATTMMMVPIAIGVLGQLGRGGADQGASSRYATGLLLGVAYSASLGGTATLVGTPPNLVLARVYNMSFPDAPPISFAGWMAFGLPLALTLLALLWCWLVLTSDTRAMRGRLDTTRLAQEYRDLGPRSFEENVVGGAFLMLAILWLTRNGINLGVVTIPGWTALFPEPAYLKDGTVAIAVALALFLVPARSEPGQRILTWHTARELPWDIVLLFGGGFALAGGFTESGLSQWIGDHLAFFGGLPMPVLVLLIALSMSFLTEVTSNTATTQIMLPLLAALSTSLNVPPLLLMVPATLACSYAFMLPVATPPNAIVFASERLTIRDMVRRGMPLNFVAVILVTLAVYLLGPVTLGIGE
jgi:sodium-dependent dicarboxylate transporter 2/3/5